MTGVVDEEAELPRARRNDVTVSVRDRIPRPVRSNERLDITGGREDERRVRRDLVRRTSGHAIPEQARFVHRRAQYAPPTRRSGRGPRTVAPFAASSSARWHG